MLSKKTDKPDVLDICFITPVLYGVRSSNSRYSAIMGAAQTAAAAGHVVTLLWAPLESEREKISAAEEESIRNEIYSNTLVKIEILRASLDQIPGIYTMEKASTAAMHYLRKSAHDVAMFALEGGLAYYSMIARETGLFPDNVKLCVLAHEPTAWHLESNKCYAEDVQQIAWAHMERYCAESGPLGCTSTHLKNWMSHKGWNIPAMTETLGYCRPSSWRVRGLDLRQAQIPAELVFFSDPDFRSGLPLLCAALDKLAATSARPKVTLLGEFGKVNGEHSGGMVLRAARNWPFSVTFLPKVTGSLQIDYLRERNCLAVIPSTDATASRQLATCLDYAIPFVATNVGGIAEQIASGDRRYVLCDPKPDALAELISRALKAPPRSCHPAFDNYEKTSRLQSFLNSIVLPPKADKKTGRTTRKKIADEFPLVTVVLVHYERPNFLPQAIASVEAQDYPNIELVVVDDGSKKPESLAALDAVEKKFKADKKGWKLLRQPNRYLGAARNAGIKKAKGARILFLDDDNALFRSAVSTLVRAMDLSGSDICTCFSKVWHEPFTPSSEARGFIHYYPLGGSLDLALIHNSVGDANAMVRREVFEKIGYQLETYGCTVQDWEFFTRAIMAGLKVRIVPEPLYWYRSSPEGMYRSSSWYENRKPILDIFRNREISDVEMAIGLLLSQNVDATDKESQAHNLQFYISAERDRALAKLDPNSSEAIQLLAEIAAMNGQPEAAMALLAQQNANLSAPVVRSLREAEAAAFAVSEFAETLTDVSRLDFRKLQQFELHGETAHRQFYVEKPDKLYIETSGATPVVAALPAGCPAGTLSVSAWTFLGEEIAGPVDFLVLATELHTDPGLAVAGASDLPSEGSSGWSRLAEIGDTREIVARFTTPTSEPRNLVFAVRRSSDSSPRKILCTFDAVNIKRAARSGQNRKPDLGPRPLRLRARQITQEELQTAQLVTPLKSDLPLLLIDPKDTGIFLRPHRSGVVAAKLPWAFPAFAKRLIAQVEIAHEDASPFEFALALVRPDRDIDWKASPQEQSEAFSGWVTVREPFRLHEISAALPEKIRTYLSVNIAIRLPRGSSPVPSNAFWRKMVITWDE